jgi:hypothetical protein
LRALVSGFALDDTEARFLGVAFFVRAGLGVADFAGALVVRLAFGAAEVRFFAGGLVARFAFGAAEARFFAGGLVARLAFALGAVDLRFFAGRFVVLF